MSSKDIRVTRQMAEAINNYLTKQDRPPAASSPLGSLTRYDPGLIAGIGNRNYVSEGEVIHVGLEKDGKIELSGPVQKTEGSSSYVNGSMTVQGQVKRALTIEQDSPPGTVTFFSISFGEAGRREFQWGPPKTTMDISPPPIDSDHAMVLIGALYGFEEAGLKDPSPFLQHEVRALRIAMGLVDTSKPASEQTPKTGQP